jgi:ATP-dependent Lon protease
MKTSIKNIIQNDVKDIHKNKDPHQNPADVVSLVEKKMLFFQDIIQKTILYVQQNKMLNILGVSDVNVCMNTLCSFIKQIKEPINPQLIDNSINSLQIINNELSGLFKLFGTQSLADLLFVCFGSNTNEYYTMTDQDAVKFELLKKYFHPISYKINSKISDTHQTLSCVDISITAKQFYVKVHGIQLTIYNYPSKKSLIINGIVDDILLDLLNNKYVEDTNLKIQQNIPDEPDFKLGVFNKFMKSLDLKDYLINDYQGIYSKYTGFLSNLRTINQKTVSNVVKEFVTSPLFIKRHTIMMLLINDEKNDNQYLAYLLYDLLTNDLNGNVDTQEQIALFDSFPLIVKQCFRDAMKKTIQYTNDLSDFDINKIPIEQQICLLNATDNVKEKAMQKLKEVKSKSEDSCSKARQYLDGLLKIPFNIYRKEPVLHVMDNIKSDFKTFLSKPGHTLSSQNKYTNIEINKYINEYIGKMTNVNTISHYKSLLKNTTKIQKLEIAAQINAVLEIHELTNTTNILTLVGEIKYKNKTIPQLKESIEHFIDSCFLNGFASVLNEITKLTTLSKNASVPVLVPIPNQLDEANKIKQKYSTITNYTTDVKKVLDTAVYGHDKAKKQIERIIGQWLNGEQDGYCFGFEGPPGVGKTSLGKKGLSGCLNDENGVGRPFAMIQMGGDSNGSSLHGHNYTYVGSTWGSIVQILIDKKCMNPIIFIDEVDKISKTEHGKEIIGILTHLLDPSQNDSFQDKYFTGIDLNLSKALFILSYNDADAIDKILLDRIHRIKFDSLSVEDKLIISKNHILPEIYKKMGLDEIIQMSDAVLKTIIEDFTCEPGVRKLKEVLFEIVAEINLDILKNVDFELPIVVTIEDIKTKYFKEKPEIKIMKIHRLPSVAVMNGLWANSMGRGGIIPIQASFFPSDKMFDLKLTGMQGDVMKESMSVAVTLAWKLTPLSVRTQLQTSPFGIHIHCPEGATPKDGPSAGTCITTVIYSLFNNLPIKNTMAITGEINLQGNVSEIGGLHLKFLGAIKAGVTEFMYPEENQKDYLTFIEKYGKTPLLEGIAFNKVSTIDEVLKIVFDLA